jgi:membrane protease YdiL (CAAX protease family)
MPTFPRWPIPICLLGLAIPVADMVMLAFVPYEHYLGSPGRVCFALFAAVLLNEVSRADRAGLRSAFDPAPSWGFWVWTALIVGGVLTVLAAVAFGLLFLFGVAPEIPKLSPCDVQEALYRMCFDAPLVEEVIYRQALVGAMMSLAGPRWAIAVSGVLFAGLHWIYGNPFPENQVGGFVLAWMYIRSGTLIVPIAFHAGGNLGALCVQLMAGYLWPRPTFFINGGGLPDW